VSSVSDQLQKELGIPVAAVHCEEFRSQVWATGFDAAYQALLYNVIKLPKQKRSNIVNIITFWGDDVFKESTYEYQRNF
jgi:nitrogenase molybdenum-iron protein alpha chain